MVRETEQKKQILRGIMHATLQHARQSQQPEFISTVFKREAILITSAYLVVGALVMAIFAPQYGLAYTAYMYGVGSIIFWLVGILIYVFVKYIIPNKPMRHISPTQQAKPMLHKSQNSPVVRY